MASKPLQKSPTGSEGIPFYRNVKVIGLLAQIVFAVVVVITLFILYRNVTTALGRSNLPADFSFLGFRAGIPIAESLIPYTTNDPYYKAFFIGFLNTLRVALLGVVLASLLGIVIGVMRLSTNWLLRQIGTAYVELIRNTPLAVQIIFWFTAVLTPIPPRVTNPIELPGGIYLSNIGLAVPWVYPSYVFSAWVPWLGAAFILFVVLLVLRRRQLERADRPGNTWLLPLAAAAVVAAIGYAVVDGRASWPENITSDFRADRGRGTVFIDADQDGVLGRSERVVPYAETLIRLEEGALEETTQNLTESRRVVSSTFRFPPFREGEFSAATVEFADPEQAQGLSIHIETFPSDGLVYEDRNGSGVYDPGEELNPETGQGYSGVRLRMVLEGFERRVVADRDGQVRIPRFNPVASEAAAAPAVGANPGNLFAPPAPAGAAETGLNARIDIVLSGPLVVSYPSIPISNYVGGTSLSTSYLALLLALVVYTAAFIAEIVRGGVQAVPRGQTEAAKAAGLSDYQTFRLVVFPQALRIILPPMISQYLNLTKNSSLAPLAAYAELFAISIIIANQTGASVPVIIMLIAAYLLISLTFAFVLNIVNARLALVER